MPKLDDTVTSVHLGDKAVQSIYLGTKQVWTVSTPPPPPPVSDSVDSPDLGKKKRGKR
jgi:hypothetical protein